MSSPALSSEPGRRTTTATTSSPSRSSGLPITAASSTAGVGVEDLLDLARVDVIPAPDHQVLGPVDDKVEAVGVHVAEIAGVQPAVAYRLRGGLGPPEIALHDVVPADENLPHVLAPGRQRLIGGVTHPHRDPPHRLADGQHPPVAGPVERARAGRLGHAVTLEHLDAILALERAQDVLR